MCKKSKHVSKNAKIIRIDQDMEGVRMAVMAKDKPNMFVLDKSKAKEFIEEFNKNVVSDEFLKDCKKASSLFRKRRFR